MRVWPYAQKSIHLNDDAMGTDKQAFLEEIRILRYVQHPHIIRFIDAFEIQGNDPMLAIVMEQASEDLQSYISGRLEGPMDQWFHCLARVVDYIHGVGIRHRDIKPQNILIKNKTVYLADFGISKMGSGQTLSTTLPEWARARTGSYCAPEVDKGSTRGKSADIFSLGAVFLEMLLSLRLARHEPKIPLEDSSLGQLWAQVRTREGKSYAKHVDKLHGWMEKQERRDLEMTEGPWDDWERMLFRLCRQMLQTNREERPKARDVLAKLSSTTAPSTIVKCPCGTDRSPDSTVDLVEACKDGSFEQVKRLVKHGTNPSVVGALHQASAYGYLSIVKFLLDCGADVNLRDYSNQTALHCAAGSGHDEVVDLLLTSGADVTAQNVDGRRALHYAAGCGRLKMVEKLLKLSENRDGYHRYVEVAVGDQNDQTALHFAAKRGHHQVVQKLLDGLSWEEKKAYVGLVDKQKRTAMHFGAGYGSTEVVRMLLEAGADPNSLDSKKSAALHFAARGRQSKGDYLNVAELLLEQGADATKVDVDGRTAVGVARDLDEGLKELLRKAMIKQEMEDPAQSERRYLSYRLARPSVI